MSAAKFDQPVYKVYEPGYHPQRTIILDEQIESPETLTIRLEEEASQHGGDFGGDCPPGLLPMSAYKAQAPQLHGYADSPYSQYSSQSFSTQQTENAAASQLNQMAFAANSAAAGQYLGPQTTPGVDVNVLSCQPAAGYAGTKVTLRATSEQDLLDHSMPGSAPFVSIMFGSQRCAAQTSKEGLTPGGLRAYTITADAPEFSRTNCASLSNVPLTLILEGSRGEEIGRVHRAGAFSYQPQIASPGSGRGGSVGGGVPGDSSPPDLGSPKTRSPARHRASPPHQSLDTRLKPDSPITHNHSLSGATATSTYGFPPSLATVNASAQQSEFLTAATTGSYSQTNNTMLSSYRSSSLTDPYARATPPMLRTPHTGGTGWMFGSHLDSLRNPMPGLAHAVAPRPALEFKRTSHLTADRHGGNGYSYGSGVYHQKAALSLTASLESMAENWTPEEWEKKRRIVMFKKQQDGNVARVSFKPVSEAERPPNSICVSCIWWEEKGQCFVTSVDAIHLLEQLLRAPNRFPVDEKNRIRRNLEAFKPTTVSKGKPESEKFFSVIMGFGNPKPRNIEKDVKVFKWSDLTPALEKIFSKYSATEPDSSPRIRGDTPAALGGPYASISPSITSALSADALASASYAGAAHHSADPLSSPRALAGGAGTAWPSYAAPPSSSHKTLSPSLKTTSSPIPASGLRLSTLPAVYDHRSTGADLTSPYGLSGPSNHNPHAGQGAYGQHSTHAIARSQSKNWDAYSITDGYAAPAGNPHGGVYGSGGAYGDGAQRA
ncbi:hypothetical protein QBC42DRAFT_313622 [Cladorrhinum samala]|uniref:DUF7082 domain-containing protein n=1 Tax=Cladorrhinum samala TaxID=585594 RepID=A0AAV9HZD1_9PEZI|nr:hypothetical protein QBC42DRAFT_313622 [Cladorrhinum samala]